MITMKFSVVTGVVMSQIAHEYEFLLLFFFNWSQHERHDLLQQLDDMRTPVTHSEKIGHMVNFIFF